MYCGEECKTLGDGQHHESARDEIYNGFTPQLKAYSSFFKALSIANGSVEELETVYNECLQSPKNVFDFNWSNKDDPEHSKNELKVALSLARDEKFNDESFVDFFFEEHPDYKKYEKIVRKIILHLNQVQRHTMCTVGPWTLPAQTSQTIGEANFLFSALLNHSCIPNVRRIFVDGKMTIVVIRSIARGEQLFDSYVPTFYYLPVHARKSLLEHYSFNCVCVACQKPERYPVIARLNFVDKKLHKFVFEQYQKVNEFSALGKRQRMAVANTIKDKLQKHFKAGQLPSREWPLLVSLYFSFLFSLAERHNFYKF